MKKTKTRERYLNFYLGLKAALEDQGFHLEPSQSRQAESLLLAKSGRFVTPTLIFKGSSDGDLLPYITVHLEQKVTGLHFSLVTAITCPSLVQILCYLQGVQFTGQVIPLDLADPYVTAGNFPVLRSEDDPVEKAKYVVCFLKEQGLKWFERRKSFNQFWKTQTWGAKYLAFQVAVSIYQKEFGRAKNECDKLETWYRDRIAKHRVNSGLGSLSEELDIWDPDSLIRPNLHYCDEYFFEKASLLCSGRETDRQT